MMTRFEDEDYNTLVLTFDKNSDIVTFENDIKEAEELNLQVNELLKESPIKNVSYSASVLGDFYPEAYVAVAEERDGCSIVPVNLLSALSMSEFKNNKSVKQNIKKC